LPLLLGGSRKTGGRVHFSREKTMLNDFKLFLPPESVLRDWHESGESYRVGEHFHYIGSSIIRRATSDSMYFICIAAGHEAESLEMPLCRVIREVIELSVHFFSGERGNAYATVLESYKGDLCSKSVSVNFHNMFPTSVEIKNKTPGIIYKIKGN